jgi:CubicO group peptidase (beta-lactamase class C family)
MQTTVLGPAGMTHSSYEQPLPASRAGEAATAHDNSGTPIKGKYHTYPEMSAAGLWTTASDLATLAIVLQHTYAGQTSAVISESTFKQMLTVQKAPFGIGYVVSGSGPTLEFSHDGQDEGFVAKFDAFASRGQGVVVMANGNNGGDLLGEIANAVAAEYGWPSHQQVARSAVPVDTQKLAALAGAYRFQGGDSSTLTVAVDHGTLVVIQPPADTSKLFAESDSTFFTGNDGTPIAFSHSGLTVDGQYRFAKVPLLHTNDRH